MFNSYDIAGEGCLDKEALSELCKSLELKDRETVLVSLLLQGNSSGRVTFKGFKEGLLNLLGTDEEDDGVSNDGMCVCSIFSLMHHEIARGHSPIS